MTNQMEYALGGDPYTPDSQRMQPVITTVTVGNVVYPAVRYRTNGAPTDYGDVGPKVMVSTDLVTWSDNETTPGVTVTEEFSSELQNDGSRLVTARVLQPLNTLPKCFIRIQVR